MAKKDDNNTNEAAAQNNMQITMEDAFRNSIRTCLDGVTPIMRAGIADAMLAVMLEMNEQAHKETEAARADIITHFWETIDRIANQSKDNKEE